MQGIRFPGKGKSMAKCSTTSLERCYEALSPKRAWYLIYTKPRQEIIAAENLTRQGFHIFLPRITAKCAPLARSSRPKAPLFPRYLFIHLAPNSDNWAPIRSTIGVYHLVRFGDDLARVPGALIDSLRQQCESDGSHCSIEQASIKVGDKVRILQGIAKDYEGIVTARSGRDRVELLLMTAAAYSATARIQEKYLERLG